MNLFLAGFRHLVPLWRAMHLQCSEWNFCSILPHHCAVLCWSKDLWDGIEIPWKLEIYVRKVPKNSLSWLVTPFQIFRRLVKGKFDAYVLWPLAKKFQNWIVDQSTAREFTVDNVWVKKTWTNLSIETTAICPGFLTQTLYCSFKKLDMIYDMRQNAKKLFKMLEYCL